MREQVMYADVGSSALVPETKTGWKTYKSIMAAHHTYATDGIHRNREPTQIELEQAYFKIAAFRNMAELNPTNMVAA